MPGKPIDFNVYKGYHRLKKGAGTTYHSTLDEYPGSIGSKHSMKYLRPSRYLPSCFGPPTRTFFLGTKPVFSPFQSRPRSNPEAARQTLYIRFRPDA